MVLPIRARSTKLLTWPAFWKLPIVFVVEDNQYAMGTASKAQLRRNPFLPAWHGLSYSRHGCERDGRARSAGRPQIVAVQISCGQGNGPVLMELQYISLSRALHVRPGQVSHARGSAGAVREHNDPIERIKKDVDRKQAMAEAGFEGQSINAYRARIVTEAADFAENSPEPAIEPNSIPM